jgi:hypothetical protein
MEGSFRSLLRLRELDLIVEVVVEGAAGLLPGQERNDRPTKGQ